MRAIKFRVWDYVHDMGMRRISELKWEVSDDGVERLFFKVPINPDDINGAEGFCHSGFGCSSGGDEYGWELMQFTGLKDKDGTEIYEGDGIEIELLAGNNRKVRIRYIVAFQDGYYMGKCTNQKLLHQTTLLVELLKYGAYIIGNIYENPELLEANLCKG